MRFLVYLTTLLLFSVAAAQSPTILQGDYISNVFGNSNFVRNPNAQTTNCTTTGTVTCQNVTVSNAEITRSTTTPLVAKSEFLMITTTSTGYADWALRTFDQGMKGQNCEARFSYRGFSVGSTTAQIRQGANVVAQLTLTPSTDPRIASINFPCGDLSSATTFRLQQATASLTGTNEIGGIYVGLATNMANVAQAEAVVSAQRGTAQSIPSGGSGVTFVFSTESYDQYDEFNTTTGVFTPKRAGRYFISATIMWDNVAWTQDNRPEMFIVKNGTNMASNLQEVESNITQYRSMTINATLDLAVGDNISIGLYQDSGTNKSTYASGGYNYLNISRFPSSSELVVTPERQNVFASVKGVGSGSNSVTTSSWTKMTSSGALTRTNFGRAKVETNNDYSITVDNLPVGSYYVSFTGIFYAVSTASGARTTCQFAVADTATGGAQIAATQADATGDANLSTQIAVANTIGGVYNNTSVASRTFFLQAYRSSATGSCAVETNSNGPITMTIIPLDQPSNSALYVQGPVKAAETGAAIPEGYVNEFSTRAITDTSIRTQAAPVAGTWYYPWTGELTLPTGNWLLCYSVTGQTAQSSSTALPSIITRIENKTDNTELVQNFSAPVEGPASTSFALAHSACMPTAITTSKVFRVGIRYTNWSGTPTVNNLYLRCDQSTCRLQAIRLN